MPSSPPRKTAAPRKTPLVAPTTDHAPADPTPAPDAAPGPATLRLKGLVDRVTASTGGKKKGVREIVEATLAQLGQALQNGDTLNLPDFGKLRVVRSQGATPGSAMTLKLRRAPASGAKKPGIPPLADPEDQR